MARAEPTVPVTRPEVFISTAPAKLSWGAIFGGAFTALGIWLLLESLLLAIGLSSMHPNAPWPSRGMGVGASIGSLVALLIALFLGGALASRTAGPVDRGLGTLHGAVVWALTMLVGVGVLTTALGALFTSAVNLGAGGERGGGGAAGIGTQGFPQATDVRVMWWVFIMLALGLISALLGAAAGVSRRQQRVGGVTVPPVTGTPVGPPREVYP